MSMSKPSLVQVIRSNEIMEMVKQRFPFATDVQLGSVTKGAFVCARGGSTAAIQVIWPADSPEGVTKKDVDLLARDKQVEEINENIKYHRARWLEAIDRADEHYLETKKAKKKAKIYGLAVVVTFCTMTVPIVALAYQVLGG